MTDFHTLYTCLYHYIYTAYIHAYKIYDDTRYKGGYILHRMQS